MFCALETKEALDDINNFLRCEVPNIPETCEYKKLYLEKKATHEREKINGNNYMKQVSSKTWFTDGPPRKLQPMPCFMPIPTTCWPNISVVML